MSDVNQIQKKNAMRFVSTRGGVEPKSLSAALMAGLAADGGLFVPEAMPKLSLHAFAHAEDLPSVAKVLLDPFFVGDPLHDRLDAIIDEAFDFAVPLRHLPAQNAFVLELFHGPTAAFKDIGARFLAGCVSTLQTMGEHSQSRKPLTVLVATSGDTGAAVGAAFHRKPGVKVVILYPDGRVSPRQAHQLGCFGDNVRALRVDGSFDDCQAMVKTLFADEALRADTPLASANSISLGRLLPQMTYYAWAALRHWRQANHALDFIIPTGNLGNAFAAIMARAMGLPIGQITLASNANRVLPEFFQCGEYRPSPSIATLANAMDVGNPSNVERLRWLYPNIQSSSNDMDAVSIDDATIERTILTQFQNFAEVICPHTACGFAALASRDSSRRNAVAVVATAHPAKFESIVEPLIGQQIVLPLALQSMLSRPAMATPIAADGHALRVLFCDG